MTHIGSCSWLACAEVSRRNLHLWVYEVNGLLPCLNGQRPATLAAAGMSWAWPSSTLPAWCPTACWSSFPPTAACRQAGTENFSHELIISSITFLSLCVHHQPRGPATGHCCPLCGPPAAPAPCRAASTAGSSSRAPRRRASGSGSASTRRRWWSRAPRTSSGRRWTTSGPSWTAPSPKAPSSSLSCGEAGLYSQWPENGKKRGSSSAVPGGGACAAASAAGRAKPRGWSGFVLGRYAAERTRSIPCLAAPSPPAAGARPARAWTSATAAPGR